MMKTRFFLGIATISILSISIAMFSSNMAFKLKMNLDANVVKYISLPYRSSITTAELLRNKIIAAGGGDVTVSNWDGRQWESWAGGKDDVNFDITPGLGLKVVTTQDVDNWLIVGSHDQDVSISFKAVGTKYVSLPYHSTSTTAAELRNEIMASAGYSIPYPPNIVQVYNWNGNSWQCWSGGGFYGWINFPIEPGVAYKVSTQIDITRWVPAHY